MKSRINHLTLAARNGVVLQGPKKTRWWHTWHVLQLFQIPLGIIVCACVAVAMYYQTVDNWHHAALAWTGAFLFMLLFWFFGYQASKDSEFNLYKTEK